MQVRKSIRFKQKKASDYKITGVILLIIAAIFLFLGVKDIITFSTKPVNLNEDSWDNLKNGQHVVIDVDRSMEFYTLNTRIHKTNGVKTSETKDGGEVLYPYVSKEDEISGYYPITKYIGVKVNEGQMSQVQKIIDQSYDYMAADYLGTDLYGYIDKTFTSSYSIHIEGTLKKMSKTEREYAEQLLTNYYGYTNSQVDKMLVPYVVKKGSIVMGYTFTGIAVVFAVIGIITLLIASKKKKEETEELYRPTTYQQGTAMGNMSSQGPDTLYTGNVNQPDTLYSGDSFMRVDTPNPSYNPNGTDPYGSYNSGAAGANGADPYGGYMNAQKYGTMQDWQNSANNDWNGNSASSSTLDDSASHGMTLNGSTDLKDWK